MREVARRAGVNHGQIQHLFAGKDGLYRAVLEDLAGGLDDQLREVEGDELARAAFEATLSDRRFVQFLARYLVEHPDGEIPQASFPVVKRLEADKGYDSRPQLAALLAAGLGWAFFSRWIAAALQLTEHEAVEVVQSIVDERKI